MAIVSIDSSGFFIFHPAYAAVSTLSLEKSFYTIEEQVVFVGKELVGKKSVFVVIDDPAGDYVGMMSDPTSDVDGMFSTLPRDVTLFFKSPGIYTATAFTDDQKKSEGIVIALKFDGNKVFASTFLPVLCSPPEEGDWTVISSCTITEDQNIGHGETWIINSDAFLTIGSGVTIVNNGTITNNSSLAGLDLGSELSGFVGDSALFANGTLVMVQGTSIVTANFTDAGATGLDLGSELSGFVGDSSLFANGTVVMVQNSNIVTADFADAIGRIDNYGTVINSNTFNNFGTFDNQCGSAYFGNAVIGNPISDACDSCIVSPADWIVTSSCQLASSEDVSGNVILQYNSTLVIPSGSTLGIDFKANHLVIESGSSLLIRSGGAVGHISDQLTVSVGEGIKTSTTLGKYIDITVTNAVQTVEFQILGPDKEIVSEFSFPASSSGEVKFPWLVPSDLIPGNYTVTADDGRSYAETTFIVK